MKTPLYELLYENNRESDEFYTYCPFCDHHNPKFAINTKTGAWHCWVCETAGYNLYQLFYAIKRKTNIKLDITIKEINEYIKENNLENNIDSISYFKPSYTNFNLPDGSKLLAYNKNIITNKYFEYLKLRKVNDYLIKKYNVYYNEKHESIIFPSYNRNNQLNYYVERYLYQEKKKYNNPKVEKNSIVFYENMINYNWPIVLVEGIFDAITLNFNSIPLLGKQISDAFLYELWINNLNKKLKIYIFLDPDAINVAYELSKTLTLYGIDNSIINNNRIKDIKNRDINDLGFKQTLEMINSESINQKYNFATNIENILNGKK